MQEAGKITSMIEQVPGGEGVSDEGGPINPSLILIVI
jgi:hypothetical protein